jgi:hypothetical protein
MTLSVKDAVLIALDGSKQYRQKNASLAAERRTPDPLLNSHAVLADQMLGLAQALYKKEANNIYAVPLAKAAELVSKGYPAKEACYNVVNTQEQAVKLASAVEDIAMTMLAEAVVADYKARRR